MELIKRETSLEKQEVIEQTEAQAGLNFLLGKIEIDQILRVVITGIFVGFFAITLGLSFIVIVLYCLNVIYIPTFVIGLLVLNTFGCVLYSIRRIINYLFPVKSNVVMAIDKISSKK